jgi:hypothetical protein
MSRATRALESEPSILFASIFRGPRLGQPKDSIEMAVGRLLVDGQRELVGLGRVLQWGG